MTSSPASGTPILSVQGLSHDFIVGGGLAGPARTVQALSEDRLNTGAMPASFVWVGGGLSIANPPPPAVEICTLVTLNADMVSDFSDADAIVGDGCDGRCRPRC